MKKTLYVAASLIGIAAGSLAYADPASRKLASKLDAEAVETTRVKALVSEYAGQTDQTLNLNPEVRKVEKVQDAVVVADLSQDANLPTEDLKTGFRLVRSESSQCVRENAACRQSCGAGRRGAAHCRARCDDRLQDCLNDANGGGYGGGDGGYGGGGSWCVRSNAACRQACGTGRSGAAHCRARCDDSLQDCLNGR